MTALHTIKNKKTLALEISKEEIAEAIMHTALFSSNTELFWVKEVYDKYLCG
ncbi:MAG: hypothetical protein GTO02_11930 [Candidatus Dadabacteria bacterium]|nr:hypothetical protein [Candidatus Dadabacteria bacterium]NIQ15062.1 hypothetical protein [Candidatus Dadabacteria bacterium]